MKKVLQQLRQYRKDTFLCIGLTALEVLMEILLPFITARLIDEGLEKANLPVVYRYGIIMVVTLNIFNRVFQKYDDLNASVQENISAIRVVKAFVREGYENRKFSKASGNLYKMFVKAEGLLANADGFIRRLPDGYDTMLTGDGANLSQGQRQLLAIARAAVADPPVLILDEATSSIDTRTERLVQDGMDALMTGRTTFVIAHRLSTVRNADCIMVMEQGRIIERGTHDELIEKKGKYYQLYTGNLAEETA